MNERDERWLLVIALLVALWYFFLRPGAGAGGGGAGAGGGASTFGSGLGSGAFVPGIMFPGSLSSGCGC